MLHAPPACPRLRTACVVFVCSCVFASAVVCLFCPRPAALTAASICTAAASAASNCASARSATNASAPCCSARTCAPPTTAVRRTATRMSNRPEAGGTCACAECACHVNVEPFAGLRLRARECAERDDDRVLGPQLYQAARDRWMRRRRSSRGLLQIGQWGGGGEGVGGSIQLRMLRTAQRGGRAPPSHWLRLAVRAPRLPTCAARKRCMHRRQIVARRSAVRRTLQRMR